jgi:hypothetical protein
MGWGEWGVKKPIVMEVTLHGHAFMLRHVVDRILRGCFKLKRARRARWTIVTCAHDLQSPRVSLVNLPLSRFAR